VSSLNTLVVDLSYGDEMELKEIADRISEKFAAAGHPIDRAKLEEKINRFVEEFSVPPAEAERSIIGDYARQFGMELPSAGPSKQDADSVIPISEIQAEQWVTVEGQIVTLIPSRSPSVAQSGVIMDSSGTMRFTVWAKANAPVMEQGKWYRLESAVADEYNGQVSLKVHSGTTITELSPDSVPEPVITPISEIKPKQWISVEGEVTTIFPPRSPSIAQSGIFADNSGTIRFTVWASANAPLLEQGHWYRLDLVESDEFNGQLSIKIHSGTKITPISRDEMPDIEKTPVGELSPGVALVEGKVVAIEKQYSDQILQRGVFADDSGAVRFIIRNSPEQNP
jgi:replication factor A1